MAWSRRRDEAAGIEHDHASPAPRCVDSRGMRRARTPSPDGRATRQAQLSACQVYAPPGIEFVMRKRSTGAWGPTGALTRSASTATPFSPRAEWSRSFGRPALEPPPRQTVQRALQRCASTPASAWPEPRSFGEIGVLAYTSTRRSPRGRYRAGDVLSKFASRLTIVREESPVLDYEDRAYRRLVAEDSAGRPYYERESKGEHGPESLASTTARSQLGTARSQSRHDTGAMRPPDSGRGSRDVNSPAARDPHSWDPVLVTVPTASHQETNSPGRESPKLSDSPFREDETARAVNGMMPATPVSSSQRMFGGGPAPQHSTDETRRHRGTPAPRPRRTPRFRGSGSSTMPVFNRGGTPSLR